MLILSKKNEAHIITKDDFFLEDVATHCGDRDLINTRVADHNNMCRDCMIVAARRALHELSHLGIVPDPNGKFVMSEDGTEITPIFDNAVAGPAISIKSALDGVRRMLTLIANADDSWKKEMS